MDPVMVKASLRLPSVAVRGLATAIPDFKILVDNREFPVNKTVLALRSTVFHKIFSQQEYIDGTKSSLTIADTTADVFDKFLQFIYTDELQFAETQYADLLRLGDYYCVESLVQRCAEELYNNLDSKSILEYITLMTTYKGVAFRPITIQEKQITIDSNF